MKDIDRKLKEEVDKEELRDFSEVWAEIKDRVEVTQTEEQVIVKKRPRRFWLTLASAIASCIILVCSISIPLLLNNQNQPIIYYSDSLKSEDVLSDAFYDGIDKSTVNVVDLERYEGDGFVLYKTEDGTVKGGKVIFFNDTNNPLFYVNLKFTSDDVINDSDETVYNLIYNIKDTCINYVLQTKDGEFWFYDVMANYKSVNYYMSIISAVEEVTQFFDEFFI